MTLFKKCNTYKCYNLYAQKKCKNMILKFIELI